MRFPTRRSRSWRSAARYGLRCARLYLDLDSTWRSSALCGDWWKLFTTQFVYLNGLYAFIALLAIAIFGWLLERRRGPAVALAVFLGAGATGALVASAVYAEPIVSGANAAALGLLARLGGSRPAGRAAGNYYEGDLLGAAAIAAVLLVDALRSPGGKLAGGRGGWGGRAGAGVRHVPLRSRRALG